MKFKVRENAPKQEEIEVEFFLALGQGNNIILCAKRADRIDVWDVADISEKGIMLCKGITEDLGFRKTDRGSICLHINS